MKKTLLLSILTLGMALSANAQLLRTHVAQGEIEGEEHEGFALYKAREEDGRDIAKILD